MAASPKPPVESGETRPASLRLQIEGVWSVEEFQSLLLTLDDVYKRVPTVMTLGDLLRGEQRQNEDLRKGPLRPDGLVLVGALPRKRISVQHSKEGFYFQRALLPTVIACLASKRNVS
jgi:hypothetical protein